VSTDPDNKLAGGEATPPRGRVLVVEDDPGTSRFLARALGRAGFSVVTAGDVAAAVDELRAPGWDAAIVDIGLPGASGFDLVREMKANHPDLPVALMTADASMDVAVRALRSEVDDFLAKPIAPAALVDQVDRLVRRRHDRRTAGGPPERALGIGAHPDDVEIGVGGILLGHRRAGDEVAVLTMSHGAGGGEGDARAREAAQAARLLGARLFLHGLEDTHISESNPTVGLIEAVIEEFRPTVVYTHSWNDLHQDHRNTHRATLVAARRVSSVYCYESPSATVEFRPARFVAIDADVERKIEMIGAYSSQVEIRSYLDPELVRSTSRYWGRFGDSRFCEPLEVVRDQSRDRTPVVVGADRVHA
jgi:LmbE family N-acetylglucosaminyl deacetylase/ActR/RegA family two-component response regulator